MSAPNVQDWRTLPAGGALDCLVAERVLGFHVERVTPEWYQRPGQPPREVLLFYRPGHDLVTYSWDAHSSNACMYRNGDDDSDGIADPLPHFSGEAEYGWDVAEALRGQGYEVRVETDAGMWRAQVWKDPEDNPAGDVHDDDAWLALARAALAVTEASHA